MSQQQIMLPNLSYIPMEAAPSKPPAPTPHSLRLSPYAWGKMRYYQGKLKTEIGGFCLCAPNDPLLVLDVHIPKQVVTSASVVFDDEGIASYVDQMAAAGRQQEEYFRIWLHTHPGPSCTPSGRDHDTFNKILGPHLDWCVMAIIGTEGAMYAELQQAGPRPWLPRSKSIIPAGPDFSLPFAASDHPAWEEALKEVKPPEPVVTLPASRAAGVVQGFERNADGSWRTVPDTPRGFSTLSDDTPARLPKALKRVYEGNRHPFEAIKEHPFKDALVIRASAWTRAYYAKFYRQSRYFEDVALFLDHWGLTLRQWAKYSSKNQIEYTVVLEKFLQQRAAEERGKQGTPTLSAPCGTSTTVSTPTEDDPDIIHLARVTH